MDMMLGIDTCGSAGSIALGQTERRPREWPGVKILNRAVLPARSASAELAPKIGEMLSQAQITADDLGVIVVVHGPGSFTGIRVGVSTAKGLAESSGTMLIAISRLALLARAAQEPHVLAALEAGRGEFYVGEYNGGRRIHESLFTFEQLREAVEQPGAGRLVLGREPGTSEKPLQNLPEALPAGEPMLLEVPGAEEALRSALPRYLAHNFDSVEALDGLYLRRTGPELSGVPDCRPESNQEPIHE